MKTTRTTIILGVLTAVVLTAPAFSIAQQVTGDIGYWLAYPSDLATGREAARTVNAYSLWFLNKYLKGITGPSLPLPGFPLVAGFMQK